MRCTAPRRAPAALLASTVLLAASTAPAATAQSSQGGCVSYNSSSTAGNLWDVTIAEPTYFSCADDGFLVGVQSTSNSSVNPLDALSWTCSGGEVIGSISSGTSPEDSVSFTVGIEAVLTSVEDEEDFPFLGDMYIGGYDLTFNGDGVYYSEKGPLGDFDNDDVVLPDIRYSSCGDASFATGVTVWSSKNYVYGVILECADLTDTCVPPSYPTGVTEGVTIAPTPSPSPIRATTDPPSLSPNNVDITPPPSPSEDITPAVDTPSPFMSTTTTSDDDSAESVSTRESSSSSVSTTIIAGVSVAGGLFVIAVCIGAACCFFLLKGRNTRHPDEPRGNFGTPAPMARRDGGGGKGGGASEGEVVRPPVVDSSAAPAPDSRGPPPSYAALPLGQPRHGAPPSHIP